MKTRLFFSLLALPFALALTSATRIEPAGKQGKVGYYTTYQDYLDKNMVEYDEYFGVLHSANQAVIYFKKDGKKVKIKGSDIWGFTFSKALFRVVPDQPGFARVISTDKIIYYENGHAHANMLLTGKDKASFEDGAYCYFSNDLNSPMLGWADTKSKWKSFKTENSEHKELFDCIEAGKMKFDAARACAAEYNGTSEMYTEE